MEVALISLAFTAAAGASAERLVRARNPAWSLAPGASMVAMWIALWWVRLPPSPAHALLAFLLADVAVLTVSVVAVLRLLDGFDHHRFGHDDDDDDLPGPCDGQPRQPDPARQVTPPRQPHRPRRPIAPRRPRPRVSA